jgi:hypothetical protein
LNDPGGEGTRRSRKHTEKLVEVLQLGVLWDEYGLVGDIVVNIFVSSTGFSEFPFSFLFFFLKKKILFLLCISPIQSFIFYVTFAVPSGTLVSPQVGRGQLRTWATGVKKNLHSILLCVFGRL